MPAHIFWNNYFHLGLDRPLEVICSQTWYPCLDRYIKWSRAHFLMANGRAWLEMVHFNSKIHLRTKNERSHGYCVLAMMPGT